MNYKKLATSFALLLLVCFNSKAQTDRYQLSAVIPPSATAASIGKYGEFPVSLYTGIPDISIPLYDIKDGPISLPVSLNYHAGGIKVEELASAVGLGWTLNFGGMISRQQRGKPDENNWTNRTQQDRIETLVNANNTSAIQNKTISIAYSDLDGEPDIFNYSFNGQSGKFFFDEAGNIYTYPAKNIKITPLGGTFSAGTGWKIVAEDGTTYEFNSADYVMTDAGQVYYDQTYTGWYLTKVTSADGRRQITLTYESFSYNDQLLFGQTKYFSTNAQQGVCYPDGPGMSYGSVTTNTQRLKQIDFNGGYMKFNYSSSYRQDIITDKSLDQVEIYTSNNTLIRKYDLAYSYFNSGGSTVYDKRLKLTSVTEKSATGQKPPYLFTYEESVVMPTRNSFARDHWGFYNGKTINNTRNTLIPSFTYVGGTYSGADREADAAFAQACVLKKINYPTGGETQFTYESNTIYDVGLVTTYTQNYSYSLNQSFTSLSSPYQTSTFTIPSQGGSVKFTVNGLTSSGSGGNCEYGVRCYLLKDNVPFSEVTDCPGGLTGQLPGGTYKFSFDFDCYAGSLNYTISVVATIPTTTQGGIRTVGGLRIKEIKNDPGTGGVPVVKKYRYDSEYDPSKSSGVLINYPDYDGHSLQTEEKNFEANCVSGPYHNCVDMVKQSTTNYPLATSQGGYVGYAHVVEDLGDNGEVRHSYLTYSNATYHQDFPYAPSESYDWHRGNEWQTKYYAKKNGQLVLAKTREYTYGGFNNIRRVYGLKTGLDHVVHSNNFTCFINNALPTLYKVYDVVTEFYAVTQVKERVYDQNDANKYAETVIDYTYSPTSYQLVETRTAISSSDAITEDEIVTRKKYAQDYSFTGTPSGQEALGLKKLQDLHVVNVPLEEYTYRQKRNISTNAISEQRVISGMITIFKSDNPYPAEVFRLETNSTIPLATYGTGSEISSNAFIKNINSTVSNSYKSAIVFNSYDVRGNLTQQQKANDVVTSYLWGYQNNYPVAQVVGSDYTTALGYVGDPSNLSGSASDELLRTVLNNVRNGLSSTKALVTSYTYQPLIGVSSVTDPNNRTTYYEFDDFGRLNLVRDQNYNILKKFCYNYFGQPENCVIYPNTDQSGNYYSQNCGSQAPIAYYVSIPAGMFTSAISVQDANTKAQQYAQNQANVNGTCSSPPPPQTNIYTGNSTDNTYYLTFYNTATSQYYYQTLNPWGFPMITIPVGTYHVTVTSGSGAYDTYLYVLNYMTYGTSAYYQNVYIGSSDNFINFGD